MGSSSEMGAKALLAIGAVVATVLGVAGLAAFFASRDDATVPQQADAPGVARAANEQPRVKPGNVVLLYSDERLTSELRAVAARIAGEPTAALQAAGQAVLVQRRPNLTVPVTAVTATRRLQATGPQDPALESFAEYWLGRAP
ncbi:MAG TPA: hypothetical protein VNT54_16000 [Solirubrobacteraceae bacterium]|nr:hypothetical protein [Solirubrobacteraceae bacterium]